MKTIGSVIVSFFVLAHIAGTASAQSLVRLNEVLANAASVRDGGVVTDWVELYNTGATAVDLSGAALSDDIANPRRFVFAVGTTIPANGYLVVHFNLLAATGFGIKANGGTLYFSDKPANGGGVIDSITYGIQAADFSIGRSPNGTGAWALTQPTPRAVNVLAQLDPPNGLVVNEWLATGNDFIELYNPGTRPVALGGLGLTDDAREPGKAIVPALSFIGVGALGAYTVFYANDARPAPDGSNANYLPYKLSASGETIYIFNSIPIHSTTFGLQIGNGSEGRLPDGSDTIIRFVLSPTPGKPNGNLGELTDIRINELLAHTDPPLEDAIEFRNMTDLPINMKGWKLEAAEAQDLGRTRTEYIFPTDFIVPANGYAVLYENQLLVADEMRFNSAHGGEVKLSQSDGNGFFSAFTSRSFGPSENGVSFGWVETSEGKDWVPLSQRTFAQDPRATTLTNFRKGKGWPNGPAKVGPIVISEIHYHPPDSGTNDNSLDEFIELRNITTRSFPLFDPSRYFADKNYFVGGVPIYKGTMYADGRTNTWRIRGDVDFNFPQGVEVPAGGTVLVVNFDPVTNLVRLAWFRAMFPDLPSDVLLFGPYKNSLKNGDGDVELKRPDVPQGPNHPDDFAIRHVPYLSVDRVRYKDAAPWPSAADGTGASLQRRKAGQYANEPLNWKAAAPSPGQWNAEPPVILTAPRNVAYVAGNDVSFAVTASGTPPLLYQWSFKGTNLPGATNAALLLENLQPNQVGIYAVVVSNDEGSVGASAELRLDAVKPVLAVTSPKPGIRWSNDVITVSGTVRDDFGVSEVLVRLNGGEFQAAAGTTNWAIDLTLKAGTNVIQVTAVDLGQNRAPTNTVRVIRVLTSPLTLTVNGGGSVSPNLNGQLLEVGRNYLITATPSAGQLFSNWTGGIVTSGNPLMFAMQSNLALQANFVANPFLAARGIYNGLFFDEAAPAHVNAGFVMLNVSEFGAYSGSLMQGTKKYAFSGRLDLDGRATNNVALGKTNIVTVEFALNLAETLKRFNGRIVASAWQASLLAEQTGFTAPATAPFAGPYTFNFLGSDLPAEPAGDGYATASVAATGAATLAGVLADGTKASQKIAVTRGDLWPVYVSLYSGKGSMFGWLAFSNTPPHHTVQGNLHWTKPALPSSKLYPGGFAFSLGAYGSRYTAPAAGERVLNLTSAVLAFEGGDLPEPVQCEIELSTDNKVTNLSTNKLTVTITPATGLFGGSLVHPVTGKAIPFKGALLENANGGGGYFLGTNASGRVQFGP